jgi:hypothetical protein
MYKNKIHIICSYLLLIVFISWQTIVSTHHHKVTTPCELVLKKNHSGAFHFHDSEIEKCQICATVMSKLFLVNELINTVFHLIKTVSISFIKNSNYESIFRYFKPRAPPLNTAIIKLI